MSGLEFPKEWDFFVTEERNGLVMGENEKLSDIYGIPLSFSIEMVVTPSSGKSRRPLGDCHVGKSAYIGYQIINSASRVPASTQLDLRHGSR